MPNHNYKCLASLIYTTKPQERALGLRWEVMMLNLDLFSRQENPWTLLKKTYEIIEIPDELSEMYTSYRHVIRSI